MFKIKIKRKVKYEVTYRVLVYSTGSNYWGIPVKGKKEAQEIRNSILNCIVKRKKYFVINEKDGCEDIEYTFFPDKISCVQLSKITRRR